jgi:predicted dehydrogenase
MARLKVGVLGLSHDHVWDNLAALQMGEHGRLVAAAEPAARLRDKLSGLHGGVATHDAFDALLERRDLDAVLVFSDNRASADWGVRALARGLPVMLEKPMAADLPGARALLAAARAAGVPLMVNWPTAWRPALRHGLTLAREGAVGDPVQLSHRGGHAGPREFGCSPEFSEWLYDPVRNGGGALVDYCGYGAVLCRLVLGRPEAVTAVTPPPRKPGLVAEDNAVAVLSYPRALGLLEASWTQIGGEPAFAMIVYGERGTLLVHQPRPARAGGRAGAAWPCRPRFLRVGRLAPPARPRRSRGGDAGVGAADGAAVPRRAPDLRDLPRAPGGDRRALHAGHRRRAVAHALGLGAAARGRCVDAQLGSRQGRGVGALGAARVARLRRRGVRPLSPRGASARRSGRARAGPRRRRRAAG